MLNVYSVLPSLSFNSFSVLSVPLCENLLYAVSGDPNAVRMLQYEGSGWEEIEIFNDSFLTEEVLMF